MTFARRIAFLLLWAFALTLASCARPSPAPVATPATAAATRAAGTPLPTQIPPASPASAQPTVEATAKPTRTVPVSYVMPGDDYGYPSPFAFYNRGPGYIRMSYLFDTLVWKDSKGYVPWLAESWQVAADGTTWTFRLRQGVRWHDGRPLTAEDVAFTFEYFKDKAAKGMVKWGWPVDKVKGAEVADGGRSVVVHMVAPTAGLLTNLFGSLPIIPKHIWQQVDDPVKKLDAEAVVGSSLFKLREYSKEEGRYVYEANADFFLGKPAVDQLAFVKVKDAALALLSGEVDEASFSGSGITSVRELRGKPEFKVIEGPSDWVLKLYFNTKRPPLDQRAVRQAVAHAVNRQEIVDKAQMGGAVVASLGLLSPGTYWYNPNLPTYPFDPAKARDILAEAGVKPFAVTLLTTDTYAREAELIKGYLQAIGIQVTVKSGDRSTVDSLLQEGNFDLLITGHGGTVNPDIARPSVKAVWSSAEYDAAYEQSIRATDDAERRQHVWKMQEIIATELPILTLWHPLMWEVYRPGKATPFYTPEGVDGGIPIALNKLMFLSPQ